MPAMSMSLAIVDADTPPVSGGVGVPANAMYDETGALMYNEDGTVMVYD